jgi:hypothetical protein
MEKLEKGSIKSCRLLTDSYPYVFLIEVYETVTIVFLVSMNGPYTIYVHDYTRVPGVFVKSFDNISDILEYFEEGYFYFEDNEELVGYTSKELLDVLMECVIKEGKDECL